MQVITEGGGEETIVCVMKTSWLQRGGVFYFTVSHGGVGVWRNTTDRGVALPTEIGNDWSSLNDCDVERYHCLKLRKFSGTSSILGLEMSAVRIHPQESARVSSATTSAVPARLALRSHFQCTALCMLNPRATKATKAKKATKVAMPVKKHVSHAGKNSTVEGSLVT